MFDKNIEIQEYLNYYFHLKNPPQYAVMLKGQWGTGKTWFIEKSIANFKNDGGKILYVSLYGITNVQQIEDEFFRQLHPVMGSKSAAFAGRLLKGFVKGTLKIDLDGDHKDDGAISVGVPDLNLPEYLKDTNGLVLVFDDLERCALPIADVLGYINYFVEHDGRKVILIGNEEEILRQEPNEAEETGNSFSRIKEKLVGKTFEISPNFSDAVDSFIGEVDLESSRELLDRQKELIKQTYSNADYKNLRHLRQAILDFSRLVEILDSDARKHDRLVAHLLSFFLLYSFEIKSGTLSPGKIGSIHSSLYASIGVKKSGETETLYAKLSRKYTGLNLLDSLLPIPVWQAIFETGLFDAMEINKSLKNSKYFLERNQPDWVRLWNAFSLSDSEFDNIISVVDKRFREFQFTELGVLRHVVSTLMMLSELGVYPHQNQNIAEVGLTTLQQMKADGTLRLAFSSDNDFLRETGFAGMTYHKILGSEFATFTAEMKKLGEEALELGYPEEALQLLNTITTSTEEFCAALVHNNYRSNRYQAIPILSYLSPDEFIDKVRLLTSEQLGILNATLRDRYATDFYRAKLKNETDWLNKVALKVGAAKLASAGKMSGIWLGYIEKTVLDAVEILLHPS